MNKRGRKMTDDETKNTEQTESKPDGKDIKQQANEAVDKASEVAGKAAEKASDLMESFAEGAKKAGAKAGEVLEDVAEGTKKAAEKAGETASDVMDNIIVGVRKASEKAADSVKIMEVKHEISKLENANKKIMPRLSQVAWDLYEQGTLNAPELTVLCDEIASNNSLIQTKLKKIEEIRATEDK
jgi:hypothetical protein